MLDILRQTIEDACHALLAVPVQVADDLMTDRRGEDVHALRLDGSLYIYETRLAPAFHIDRLAIAQGEFDVPDVQELTETPLRLQDAVQFIMVELLKERLDNWTANEGEREAAEQEDYYDDTPDDSMDGDHASALASCGWGTDEDYGCYDGGLEE